MGQADIPSDSQQLRVLVLAPNQGDSGRLRAQIGMEWVGAECLCVETGDAFARALGEFRPDIVLADFDTPGFDGGRALQLVRNQHPEIPLIMLASALSDVEAAALIRDGARDYMRKNELSRLNTAIRRALQVERGIRTRKAAELAVQQSERELRDLVAHSPVAKIVESVTPAGSRVSLMNRKFTELFGYTLEDIPDIEHWWRLAYPDEAYRSRLLAEWGPLVERALREQTEVEPRETEVTCKDGSVRNVRISYVSLGSRNIVTFEDMTGHRLAEANIRRLNQLYAALRECSQAIVRSGSEQELYAQVCNGAVQFGLFRMAWIGRVDQTTRQVLPVASAGDGAGEYLRDIRVSVEAESEYGKGPTGTAIRDNHPVWCQDFLGSAQMSPWRSQAARLGWRSSAALPLRCEGKVVAAFMLYADVVDAFSQDVRDLLQEMADDISYALDNLKHEAQRKQAENELRKLSQAVEQSPSSIVIADLEANIEYVNDAFVRVTGFSREEAIGQNPRILQSGRTERVTYDEMWAHLTSGRAWRGELINRRKDGSEYYEDMLISPVRDAEGRITHYLAIKDDITARKLVEKALLESEERFRVMSASAQDAIVMIDQAGRVSFWNRAAEKIFGYAAAEMLAQDMHRMLVPERYHEAFRQGFAHFQTSGEGRLIGKTLEVEVRHKDGHEFPVELSLSAVMMGGGWQAIGILRDITERKEIEAQLRVQYEHVYSINRQLREANQQLESAKVQLLQSEKMAAIGLLAAGVAHEINNPVGYVNSNLGTLQRYLAALMALLDKYETAEASALKDCDQVLEEVRQFKVAIDFGHLREDVRALIAESQQGLDRIKKIIIDLKDFARSEASEQWVLADVHLGLDSTLNVVWNELKYKCELVKEYGELPQIWCLPSQLNQVFMNLLVNAAQAIEKQGRVTLRTGRQGDEVWIEVADTGSGIPPESLSRIFDPFFTTKPVGKGTGLGLAVSYKIVEKHHGRIEVQSEEGRGTTFRIWLPIRQPEIEERA